MTILIWLCLRSNLTIKRKEISLKVDDTVETIAKFFNDLISTCVPGLVLIIGLVTMHLGPVHLQSLSKLTEGIGGVAVTGLLFAIGHLLLAVNQNALKPLLNYTKILKVFDDNEAKKRLSYKWLAEVVINCQQVKEKAAWDFHDLRSVALSVSPEAAILGRRFMFISLLCSGVGTALLTIGIDYLICSFFAPSFIYSYEQAAPWYVQTILLFGAALLLFKQGADFYVRAMTAPFSVAVADIMMKKNFQ